MLRRNDPGRLVVAQIAIVIGDWRRRVPAFEAAIRAIGDLRSDATLARDKLSLRQLDAFGDRAFHLHEGRLAKLEFRQIAPAFMQGARLFVRPSLTLQDIAGT